MTRSNEELQPENLTLVPTPGDYYAIRAEVEDFEDGFCISKAVKCYSNSFQGVYLEKEDSSDSKFRFRETKNVGRFDIATVVSQLYSANLVNACVEVDQNEVEDIIVSLNAEN